MKIQSVIALILLITTGLVGGCIDSETEQACISDGDCLGNRVCTSGGECVWPEASEEIAREDAEAPDEVDAGAPLDIGTPFDPGPDGSIIDPADTGPDAEVDTEIDTAPGAECPAGPLEALPRAGLLGSDKWETESIETIPLNTIQFDASESTGDFVRYEWSIIERPSGSTQRLVPASSVEDPRLFLDLAGIYVIQLRVFSENHSGTSCSSTATIEIRACACDTDVHIQLIWNTPADEDQTDEFGTDIDMHYLHENGHWNDPPWDIFWRNSTADWGPQGTTGDPRMDIDDTNGAGPENINHSDLERVNYRVGAYYYSDSTLGASYATVRIYVRGQLEFERANRLLETTGTFWEVASIRGPSGGITSIDRITQGFP